MIIKYSTLLKLRQLEKEYENDQQFPVFVVQTEDEADKLNETLNGIDPIIIIDDVKQGGTKPK